MSELRMPKVTFGDSDVTILRWLKAPGDDVAIGEPVVEIETDKAQVEVESTIAGVLLEYVVQEGDTVAAGEVIAHIDGGAPLDSDDESAGNGAGATRAPVTGVPDGDLGGVPVTVAWPPGSRGRLPASTVQATSVASLPSDTDSDIKPLSRRRLAIARVLGDAALIPQVVVVRDLSVGPTLDALSARSGTVTLSDVLIAATARVASSSDSVNAWMLGDGVRQFADANVAYAVDTPEGVVAPVIAAANRLSLEEIAARRADLVERARGGGLRPSDVEGGTLSISNVGPLGAHAVHPLITPPQVLAIGAGRARQVGAEVLMNVAFVADHRVVDGGDGARFLAALDAALEEIAAPLRP